MENVNLPEPEETEASRALELVTSFLAYVRANGDLGNEVNDTLDGLAEMWAEDLAAGANAAADAEAG